MYPARQLSYHTQDPEFHSQHKGKEGGGQERKERNSKFFPLKRAVVVALDVYRFLRQLIPFAALAPSILLLGGAENLPLQ